jgi:hypothetical protein
METVDCSETSAELAIPIFAEDEETCVGFKVSTAVTMKNAVFWDVAPCGFIIN